MWSVPRDKRIRGVGQFPHGNDVACIENSCQESPAFSSGQSETDGADGEGCYSQQDEAHALEDPGTGQAAVP